MAGGNYTSMNKVRPGAYFQRLSDSVAEETFNPEGILCWVKPTRWGKPVSEISLEDYSKNACYAKIGLPNDDERLQIFSQYARRLVVANPLENGRRARAVIREEETAEEDISNKMLHVEIRYSLDNASAEFDDMEGKTADVVITFADSGSDISSIVVHALDGSEIASVESPDDVVSGVNALVDEVKEHYSAKSAASQITVDGKNVVSDLEISASAISALSDHKVTFVVDLPNTGISASAKCSVKKGNGLDVVARYFGTLGNEISLVIVNVTSVSREVRTTVNGSVVDSQIIGDWSLFQDNDWVQLEGLRMGLPKESDPINLKGGTDGESAICERILSDAFVVADGVATEKDILLDGDGDPIPSGESVAILGEDLLPIAAEEGLIYTLKDGDADIPEGVIVEKDGEYGNLILTNNSALPYAPTNSLSIVISKPSLAIAYGMAEDESSNYNVDGIQLVAKYPSVPQGNVGAVSAILNGQVLGSAPLTSVLGVPPAIRVTLPASRGGDTIDLHPFLIDADEGTATFLEAADLEQKVMPKDAMVAVGGGNHGHAAPYGDLFKELRYHNWSVLVMDDQSRDGRQDAVDYVNDLRENCGLYRRLVVCAPPKEGNYEFGDNEYDYDFVTNQATTWRDDRSLSAFVRAAMACCSYNESNTYQNVPIADAPDQMLTQPEIENCLRKGFSLCTRRDDGIYVIEKDINTFHNYTNQDLYALTKNRVIRTIDYICTIIRYYWELEFCGKVTNDDIGRNMWKSRVQEILADVTANKGLSDYTNPIVSLGNKLDEVITQIGVWPLDSMEIVYVQIKLNV